MTIKVKERLINIGISFVTAFGAVFLSFALFTGDAKTVKLNNELENKAPYEYVNNRDAALQKNIDDNKADNQADHVRIEGTMKEGFKEIKAGQKRNTDLIIEEIRR